MRASSLLLAGVILVLTAAPCAWANPLARWSFDEEGGDVAEDSINDVDGMLEGGASFAPGEGIVGGALELDASTGDYVTMGDNFSFLGIQPFAIQAWVKTTMTAGAIIAGRHVNTVTAGYWLGINDTNDGAPVEAPGSFHLFQSDTPALNSGDVDINDGQWHQLVAVRNAASNDVRLYVDGQRVPTEDATGPLGMLVATSAPFLVGASIAGDMPVAGYTGLLDEVRLWMTPLSDEEVGFFYEHPESTNAVLCGDANESVSITATDSLAALRTAVGSSFCFDCICDANGAGGVTATDALVILNLAVGLDVATACPVCIFA